MRRRALALLLACAVLAGCGASGKSNQGNQQDPPRYRPNSNQNPGYDGSG